MKKRILALFAIVVLLSALVAPMAVLADVVVTGDVEVPTVTSIDPVSGVQGNTYTGVAITGTYLTDATAVTFSTSGVTASAINVTSPTAMTVTVAITAGATVETGDVSVTTPGGTGTLTGGFTVVESSITVTAPNGIALGDMVKETTTTGTADPAGSVTTNAQNWQVTALDSTTVSPNQGHMTKSGPVALIAPFQISRLSTTTGLADAVTGITYDQDTNTDKFLPFYVSQAVASGDVAGSYTITITFTGSTS